MTVFEYITLLFKRPGVREKNENKILLNSPKPMTEIFTFKLEQLLNDIEKRLFLHPIFLDKLYSIGYLNKYITVLKEFASFVYLAQVAALDINVLFISADLQI